MVVTQTLYKIARNKLHVVKLRKIENVRFCQHGCGNVQCVTNVRQIIEKVRIREFFGVFIYELFTDSAVRHQFCPYSHIRIIHEKRKKVNYL